MRCSRCRAPRACSGAAVLQSGAAHHTLTAATAGRVADYLAAELGVPATAAALRSVPIEQVIRAQKVLTRQLQAAPDPARWGEIVANIMMFEPVVDGEILPGPPWQRIAAGSAAGVDVLVGANRHEHRFFLVPTGVVDQVDAQAVAAVADRLRAARRRARPLPAPHARRVAGHRCWPRS